MNRLKDCWHLLNMPCEGMSRLASESLDRDLSRAERAALRLHVFYCSACRRYQRHIKLIRCAMQSLASHLETESPLAGPCLPDHVRERIKSSLKRN